MKAPSRYLESVVALAIQAGDKILEIYRTDFRIGHFSEHSPFTAANLVSHHYLTEALQAMPGGYPVLSELSLDIPFEDRGAWETYWLLDPLDGTCEFIRHVDEFTVNIALIHRHKPVLGVVYAPTLQTCYFAAEGCGAFKKIGKGDPQTISVQMQATEWPNVVVSRSHPTPGVDLYLNQLGHCHSSPLGSALKFCHVAEGVADLYPRIGLSCEWDTAAAQCIVEAAGGAITDLQGRSMLYNAKPSLVNPFFLAYGDKTQDWTQFAKGITDSPSSAPRPASPLLKAVVGLVKEAGKRVLEIYATDFRVGSKADNSPLTAADLVSHHCLSEGLEALPGNFPVLSAESWRVSFEERKAWDYYWLVDPLNGTEEFIKRNGEFTLNVALIHRNKTVLGVVYAPVRQTCYFSAEGCGVFKAIGMEPPMEIKVRTQCMRRPVVVGNAELSPAEESYLANLGEHRFMPLGSSLKFCKIAEGKADLYPCLIPSFEWDTAAAQYIVEAAGGRVVDLRGEPLSYNAEASLLNPFFLVFADESKDWKAHALEFHSLKKRMAA